MSVTVPFKNTRSAGRNNIIGTVGISTGPIIGNDTIDPNGGRIFGRSAVGDGGWTGIVIPPITRDMITWGGANEYATLNTPVVHAGDFENSVEFVMPDYTITGNSFLMLLGSTSGLDYVGIESTGKFRCRIAGNSSSILAPVTITPFNSKEHTATIKRAGTVGSLLIDGVEQFTWVVPATNSTWDLIANSSGTFHYAGQLYGAIYVNTEGIIPVVLQRYNLDSNSVTIEYAVGKSGPDPEYITFSNVIAGDWENVTWDSVDYKWEGDTLTIDTINDTFYFDNTDDAGAGDVANPWGLSSELVAATLIPRDRVITSGLMDGTNNQKFEFISNVAKKGTASHPAIIDSNPSDPWRIIANLGKLDNDYGASPGWTTVGDGTYTITHLSFAPRTLYKWTLPGTTNPTVLTRIHSSASHVKDFPGGGAFFADETTKLITYKPPAGTGVPGTDHLLYCAGSRSWLVDDTPGLVARGVEVCGADSTFDGNVMIINSEGSGIDLFESYFGSVNVGNAGLASGSYTGADGEKMFATNGVMHDFPLLLMLQQEQSYIKEGLYENLNIYDNDLKGILLYGDKGIKSIVINGAVTEIETAVAHNYSTNAIATHDNVWDNVPDINGQHTVTVIDPTHYSIPVTTTVTGKGGTTTRFQGDYEPLSLRAAITKGDVYGAKFNNIKIDQAVNNGAAIYKAYHHEWDTLLVSNFHVSNVGGKGKYDTFQCGFDFGGDTKLNTGIYSQADPTKTSLSTSNGLFSFQIGKTIVAYDTTLVSGSDINGSYAVTDKYTNSQNISSITVGTDTIIDFGAAQPFVTGDYIRNADIGITSGVDINGIHPVKSSTANTITLEIDSTGSTYDVSIATTTRNDLEIAFDSSASSYTGGFFCAPLNNSAAFSLVNHDHASSNNDAGIEFDGGAVRKKYYPSSNGTIMTIDDTYAYNCLVGNVYNSSPDITLNLPYNNCAAWNNTTNIFISTDATAGITNSRYAGTGDYKGFSGSPISYATHALYLIAALAAGVDDDSTYEDAYTVAILKAEADIISNAVDAAVPPKGRTVTYI